MKQFILLLTSSFCLWALLCINTAVAQNTNICEEDCVYPGNTTAGHQQLPTKTEGVDEVNAEDLLIIGLGYGLKGATRNDQSISFGPKACDNWNDSLPDVYSPINPKHADCNGDGIVDYSDLTAIRANYGKPIPIPIVCEFTDPIQDLEWLNDIVFNEYGYCNGELFQVYQATLPNNETVFYLTADHAVDDGFNFLYSCDGTLLCQTGGIAGIEEPTGCYSQYFNPSNGSLPNSTLIFDQYCNPPNTCDFTDPLTDLDWLQNLIEQGNCCYNWQIYQYESWDNISFFEVLRHSGGVVNDSLPCPVDMPSLLYNCSGNILCSYGGEGPYVPCIYHNFPSTGTLIYDCEAATTNNCDDLSWMETYKDSVSCINTIAEYQDVNGETVYFLNSDCNVSDDSDLFTDCEGNIICQINGFAPNWCEEAYLDALEYIQLVWQRDSCFCIGNVDPVCGSNGVTYSNSCAANCAGVFSFTFGACSPTNPISCIDSTILQSFYTIDCGDIGLVPVCGCDSTTYAGICDAGYHGIGEFTLGSCEEPWQTQEISNQYYELCLKFPNIYNFSDGWMSGDVEFIATRNDDRAQISMTLLPGGGFWSPDSLTTPLPDTYKEYSNKRIIYDSGYHFSNDSIGVLYYNNTTDTLKNIDGLFLVETGQETYIERFLVEFDSDIEEEIYAILGSINDCGESDSTTCEFTDPINDLSWLHDLLFYPDGTCNNNVQEVRQGTLSNGETVFIVAGDDFLPGHLYSCDGTLLCTSGGTGVDYVEEPAGCVAEYYIKEKLLENGTTSIYSGCDPPPITCEFTDPINDLPWLHDLVFNAEGWCNGNLYQVYQSTSSNNETVFILMQAANDGMTIVYDCSGNILCEAGGIAGIEEPAGCYSQYFDNSTGSLLNGTLIFDQYCNPPNACTFNDPLTDLDWLQNLINQGNCCSNWQIYQYETWDSTTLFEVVPTGGTVNDSLQCPVDEPSTLYNCSGEIMCIYGGESPYPPCYLKSTLGEGTLIYECGGDDNLTSCIDSTLMQAFDFVFCVDDGLAPICGCDDNTYQGLCHSGHKGITEFTLGSCEEPWLAREVSNDYFDICLFFPQTYNISSGWGEDTWMFNATRNDNKAVFEVELGPGTPYTPDSLTGTLPSTHKQYTNKRIIYHADDFFNFTMVGVFYYNNTTATLRNVEGIFLEETAAETYVERLFVSFDSEIETEIHAILGSINDCEGVNITACQTEGWLRYVGPDYSEFASMCQWLIELTDGTYLLPMDSDTSFLQDGLHFLFDYQIVQTVAETCHPAIEITCLTILPENGQKVNSQINGSIRTELVNTVPMPNGDVLYDFAVLLENENDVPIQDAYGIAFSVNFTSSQPTVAAVNFNTQDGASLSWLGNTQSDNDAERILCIDTVFANPTGGKIDIGITRIDHQPISGSGQICQVACVATIEDWGYAMADFGGESELLTLTVDNIRLINQNNEDIPTKGITQSIDIAAIPPVSVQVQAILEAAYLPEIGLMNTYLSSANLLPLTQPFAPTPWHYNSDYEQLLGQSQIPNNAVDWVLLELRSANEPDKIAEQKAAFLLNDGSIVDKDYVQLFGFEKGVRFYTLNPAENYFVVLRSRNHLAVMSRTAISINNQTLAYDFTTSKTQAKGQGQLKALNDTQYALHAGDVNGDGIITVNDFNRYTKQLGNSTNSYSTADLNLDTTISTTDFNLYRTNASIIGIPEIRYE